MSGAHLELGVTEMGFFLEKNLPQKLGTWAKSSALDFMGNFGN